MSPYERYRHIAFTLDEFSQMVKANKEHFINYCEWEAQVIDDDKKTSKETSSKQPD